jgi:hypothetical protein
MSAEKIRFKDKPGIEELTHGGPFAVIANRELYDLGKAHKFALVNIQESRLNSVYSDPEEARSELRSLRRVG